MRRGTQAVVVGLFAWVACLLGVAPRQAVAQQDPVTLAVSVQHSIFYPPGDWVPLRLEVKNNSDRELDGYVSMPVTLTDDAGVELRVPMRVAPRSRVVRTAFAYFPEEPGTPAQRRSGDVPPVTTAEFRTADGARLAQQPLLARPMVAAENANYAITAPPATTLVLNDGGDPDAPAFDNDAFVQETLQPVRGHVSAIAAQELATFARHTAALDGVAVMLVGSLDPDALDVAQREALMTFIRGGGIVVVSSPDPARFENSWLAPHLPVQLIGRRLMDRVQVDPQRQAAFLGYVPVTEALAGDGEVLVQDAHYVHVAYGAIGMGRLVFTSFPVNALKDDPWADALWTRLLRGESAPRDWQETKLVEARDALLSRMIGKRVAPWGLAAGVTGAYLLGVVGVQVLLNGARRPRAFAVTLGLAGALSIGLVAMGMTRQTDQQPMAARVATIDASAEGGGTIREAVAYVGADDEQFALTATGSDVTLRAMDTFTAGDKPIVMQHPFAAPQAGMRTESYQRVWSAQGRLANDLRLSAVGQFDEQGLSVKIDNALGGPLSVPGVVWGRSMVPLATDTAGVGETTARAGGAAGGAAMIVSGQDKLRTDVLTAALSPASQMTVSTVPAVPSFVGFLDESAVPLLLEPSRDLTSRTTALVRAPLQIRPTPVGQRVRVPGEMMPMVTGRASGLPYDYGKNEWLDSQIEQAWLIGFRPPTGIGALRPARLLIDANLNAPRHRVSLYPAQLKNGRVVDDQFAMPVGEPLVTWENPVGARDAVVELDPGAADADGVVWVRLGVEKTAAAVELSATPTPWRVIWLRAGYEAEVVGPPPPPSLTVVASPSESDEKDEKQVEGEE